MDTTKNESGLPIPSDLISRKAITASDVVKPTRKCNGVTKFPKSLKKIGSFYSMKKSLAQVTHHHVYKYVFFYPSRFRSGRRNSHIFCKYNESFVSNNPHARFLHKSFFFQIYFLHLQGGSNDHPLFDFVYSFFH